MLFDIRAKSLFAKLLANENIMIIEDAKIKTAAFDTKNRRLYLPKWDNITEDVSKLLISHEVAHALYTPDIEWRSAIESVSKEKQHSMKHILNVIEDVRIEYKIITKYPSLRINYIKGYKHLLEVQKFFGEQEDFKEKYGFLDRLNIHLKMNVTGKNNIDLGFDEKETDIANRAVNCKTFDDVFKLAQELLPDYTEEQPEISPSMFFEFLEEIFDFIKSNINNNTPFSELLDENSKDPSFKNKSSYQKSTHDFFQIPNISNCIDNSFKERSVTSSISLEVKYIRSVFNRKKSAERIRNQKRTDSGILDMNNISNYKMTRKLFSIETTKTKQKNHGLVILIDGSGSMSSIIDSVIDQCVNLRDFCALERIPVEFYVFNSSSSNSHISSGFKLLPILMKKNTKPEPQNLISGSTPLCDSLLGMFKVIETFQSKHRVDKLSFIVMTDGGCDSTGKTYNMYYNPKTKTSVSTEETFRGCMDSSPALYKLMKDQFDINILSLNLTTDCDMVVTDNKYGVDRHIDMPVEQLKLTNSPNSRIFIQKYMELIS